MEIKIGWELGYTPNNLLTVKRQHKLTYQQIADLTSTKSGRTAAKWVRGEADMPYKKWTLLLNNIPNKEKQK